MFLVRVPKEFTPDQKLTWTLTINGQTTQIPLRLHRDYNVNPFRDIAVGNKPPIVRLTEKGPTHPGPGDDDDRCAADDHRGRRRRWR